MEKNPFQIKPLLVVTFFVIVALLMPQTNSQCPLPCTTCLSSLNCTACLPNLNRVKGTANNYICTCPVTGQFYNPVALLCQTCSVAVPNCLTCKATVNGVTCNQCDTAFYLLNATACSACPANCLTCQDLTKCTSCAQYYVIKNFLCVLDACINLIPECLTCTVTPALTCLTCNPGFYVDGTGICVVCPTNCLTCDATSCLTCVPQAILVLPTCELCATTLTIPGCTQCNSSNCLQCDTTAGYTYNMITFLCETPTSCLASQVLVGGFCQNCSVHYTPNCIQCDLTICQMCASGFVYNSTTLFCDQICATGEVSINGACPLCSQHYNPQCVQCDTISCTVCLTGYFYNTTSAICQANPTSPVCGDGFWMDTVEPCDDGNFVNLDGCDSKCQVEPDYSCLVADKLGTGASLCKYTRNFTITLNYLQKQLTSNIVHAYFTIDPPTFQQWTSDQIQKIMNPLSIVDKATGNMKPIPVNKVSYSFTRVNNINSIQLTIDYDGQSIQSTFLKFPINRRASSLSSINTLPPQTYRYVKLSSPFNGVDLYSYSSETYAAMNLIEMISMGLGYLALAFAVLGLISPVGKLIVVEALAVTQLSFFSIIELKKIPPSLIGFKSLANSNGFNIVNLLDGSTTQTSQSIFNLLGMSPTIVSNFNLSFVTFIFLPFLIGAIGSIISRGAPKKKMDTKDIMNSLIGITTGKAAQYDKRNQQFAQNLKLTIFKRILIECSFYGIMITGYLAWVSIFEGLKDLSLSNAIFAVVTAFIWGLVGFKFIKSTTSYIQLKKHPVVSKTALEQQNSWVAKQFGDFKEISRQISKVQTFEQGQPQRIYVVYMLQRMIVSGSIVYFTPLTDYPCAIIIAVYSIALVVLIVGNHKLQSHKKKQQRATICSHLHKNYILRQLINFLITILIQVVIMIQQMMLKGSGHTGDAYSTNPLTVTFLPIAILSLISINLIANIVFWVLQHKNSQIITKAKEIAKVMYYKPDEDESVVDSVDEENLAKAKIDIDNENKGKEIDSTRRIIGEENDDGNATGNVFDTSMIHKPIDSALSKGEGKQSRKKKMAEPPKLKKQALVNIEEADLEDQQQYQDI